MEEAKANNWVDHVEGEVEEEEELVRELLDDESPFFLLPHDSKSIHQSISTLISTVYSGPTIQDIDNALSLTTHSTPQSLHQPHSQFRGFSKIENNKYSLKLKTCGNGMADDGYKWRKYGQKSIKNSPFPRSYYRCTNPRCSAKKQVERSSEEEDTIIVTYEGLHLHFAYPYSVIDQPQFLNPSTKKAKKTISESEAQKTKNETKESPSSTTAATGTITSSSLDDSSIEQHSAEAPQGLLEDVVPFFIRNPLNNNTINNPSSNSSTCSCYPSPPASPSSFSCSPNHYLSRFDVGIM